MKLADIPPRTIYGPCGSGEPAFKSEDLKRISEKQKRYRYRKKLAELMEKTNESKSDIATAPGSGAVDNPVGGI